MLSRYAVSEKRTVICDPGISGSVCIWMDRPTRMIPGHLLMCMSFGKTKIVSSICLENAGSEIPGAGFLV
jgi:hypothetical protein